MKVIVTIEHRPFSNDISLCFGVNGQDYFFRVNGAMIDQIKPPHHTYELDSEDVKRLALFLKITEELDDEQK
jgi:hypothetical protein